MVANAAHINMVDVQLPTTDGRSVILSRCTEPEADQSILLQQMKISLRCSADVRRTNHGKSNPWAIPAVE